MAAHASATEARAIERRTGTMPNILAADPIRWQIPPSETCAPSTLDGGQDADTAVSGDDRTYLNTREAALRLGLSPRTLDRYRVTGEGPVFFRFGRLVRYRGEDLAAWAAGRRGYPIPADGGVRPGAG